MEKAARRTAVPLNPGEASLLKAQVFDLSESGSKQALYGIIQILQFKGSVSRVTFEEVVGDAMKYTEVKKGG